MKCQFCYCRVENSNEIDGYQPDGCFYGDDYLDDCCYEDKDGDCCCDKTKEEIENDIEVYQECMRYEEDGADIDCWNEIVVREDDGEWREPLVEVEV